MRWLLLTGLFWTVTLAIPAPPATVETRTTWWTDSQRRSEGTFARDVRHGEFRSWHSNGQLAQLHHYVDGKEAGRQQAWTPAGVMFLNYDVRNGRRYGLVNSTPCLPADEVM